MVRCFCLSRCHRRPAVQHGTNQALLKSLDFPKGQAHIKERVGRGGPEDMDEAGGTAAVAGYAGTRGSASPPMSPGSPLTYSPQVPMEPIPTRGEEAGRGGSVYGQSEFAGWAAQPKLVPTVFVWAHGGSHVDLEGSFDNWTQRHTMQRSGKDFTLVKLLPPGEAGAVCPVTAARERDRSVAAAGRQHKQ